MLGDTILPTSFARLTSRMATFACMKDGTDRFLATFGPAQYHSADDYLKGLFRLCVGKIGPT